MVQGIARQIPVREVDRFPELVEALRNCDTFVRLPACNYSVLGKLDE